MKQAEIFLNGEGDAWLERNRAEIGARDPVWSAIRQLGILPNTVLEIGCSNGWRLEALRTAYGCNVFGIEPSREAAKEAAARHVQVMQATAAEMPIDGPHHVVIFGFCLYLTDPVDWFKIVSETDRVLADGGYLIIHDFNVGPDEAFARHYRHRPGVMAFHIDFANFWLAHPYYKVALHRPSREMDEMVTVLKKDSKASMVIRP